MIRPIALNRKNIPCAGHDEDGTASQIETCKINGVEPFASLKTTLMAIANSHPQSRIDDLLHWNVMPSPQASGDVQRPLANKAQSSHTVR